MTVPVTVPPKSYRFYGDGPGVSIILFETDGSHPSAGINAPNIKRENLNVEGLTLKAGMPNCGTAIDAKFGPHSSPTPPANPKFHTATVHNVQIMGSATSADSPGYWTSGIHLYRAQNSVIDKVEISGRRDYTQTGIVLDNDTSDGVVENTTGFQVSNIAVKWCNVGLKMAGWVEGLYMTGFEFFSCGRGSDDNPSISLKGSGGTPGAFQLVNGLVDTVGGGLHMSNFIFAKVSNVTFKHNGSEVANSTLLSVDNVNPVVISECSFYGMDPHGLYGPFENGIFVKNATAVQVTGNYFTNMQSENAGSGIVVYTGNSVVRVTDNVFTTSVGSRIANYVGDTYFCGNSPTDLCDGVTP
ncbi:MAG: hypothetical protein QOC70_2189 [Verrucomicrobiota bacterium]